MLEGLEVTAKCDFPLLNLAEKGDYFIRGLESRISDLLQRRRGGES